MAESPLTESRALDWIDNYYLEIVKCPEMYASSPSALEDIVWVLESLRHDLLTGKPTGSPTPYQNYLAAQGFHAASFTASAVQTSAEPEPACHVSFADYVAFLRRYLSSQGRDAGS